MSSLTHSLIMKPERWHVRAYRYWLSQGGKRAQYKENLCRYFWIVVARAPMHWLCTTKYKRIPVVILALVGAEVVLTFLSSIYLGLVVTGVLALVAVFFVTQRGRDLLYRVTRRPFSKLAVAGDWFFGRSYYGATPFIYFLGLGVLTIIAGGFYITPIITAAILGGVILAAAVIYAVEKLKKRQNTEVFKSAVGRAYEGVADTVKLGATYLATKKRGSRICPFIEFEDELPKAV